MDRVYVRETATEEMNRYEIIYDAYWHTIKNLSEKSFYPGENLRSSFVCVCVFNAYSENVSVDNYVLYCDSAIPYFNRNEFSG